MSARNIIVFLSSVRPNRMADRVASFVKAAAEDEGLNVTIVDPLELNFEVVKAPFHWLPKEQQPKLWVDLDEKIRNADAFLIVSAEYNNGIPPALSNTFDHFAPASFRHRPCGLITYSMGIYGGIRVVNPLFSLVNEFGMLCLPTVLSIPNVHETIDSEGKCSVERTSEKLKKLVDDLTFYTDAIANHKNIRSPLA
jgi:NAD(P)H-dependent FMN reductase